MNKMKSWLMASRPKTLTAAFVPVIVASCLAGVQEHLFLWWVAVLSLLASFFIQIGTNLVNDAIDFKKGADTAERIGPQRVTQAGIFKAEHVLWMGTFCFLVAILCGVPLVLRGGLPILIIGLFSVLLGYGYTAGPFPLAYKGLGDFFVVLFFGIIPVAGVFFLHADRWNFSCVVAGLQIGLHCAVLIAINNLRDREGDRLVDKKTIPVRFGQRVARWEIAFLAFLPFVLGTFWLFQGFLFAFLLPFAALPLAFKITKMVFETEPGPAYNGFLGKAAKLHLAFGSFLAVGFFL